MTYEKLLDRLEEPTNDRMDAHPGDSRWHLRGDSVLVRNETLDEATDAIRKLETENEQLRDALKLIADRNYGDGQIIHHALKGKVLQEDENKRLRDEIETFKKRIYNLEWFSDDR
jgi:hypothetical protein